MPTPLAADQRIKQLEAERDRSKHLFVIDDNFCGNPYPSYNALRASGTLHWSDEFCGGAWLLPNYEDVLNVLCDPRFSTQRGSRWINSSGPEAKAAISMLLSPQ